MANTYITINGSKLTVREGSVGGDWFPNSVVRRTLNGRTYKSVGLGQITWTYTVLIKWIADAGYMSYSTYATLAQNQTVSGNTITLTDEYGVSQGNCVLVNASKPKKVSTAADDKNALYSADIEIQKSQ